MYTYILFLYCTGDLFGVLLKSNLYYLLGNNFMLRENDRKKFVDLAENRVNKTLNDIRLIGNLSNKSNYSYTDEDVKKIYSALKTALDEMKVKFEIKGSEEKEIFRL